MNGGTVVEAAFKQSVARRGARLVALERYPTDRTQMQAAIRTVAQAATRADALFIPDGADSVTSAVQMLTANGVNTRRIQLIGTGLWDDPRIFQTPALDALARIHYAAVLMDCQMPEMDGFEATATIRRSEGTTRHTTIIALTANAMQGDQERCLAAGMDDYLSKPFTQEKLRKVLLRWKTPTPSQQEETPTTPAKSEVATPLPASSLPVLDETALVELRKLQRQASVQEMERLRLEKTVANLRAQLNQTGDEAY